MILRLNLYRSFLKMAIYSLSIAAFFLGWWIWKGIFDYLDRPTLYSPQGHMNQIIFAALVWAFVSERYKVTNFDELFRERTGMRAASSASIVTLFVLLATLYFSRNELFPRGLLVCDIIAIFTLTILVHAIFRSLFRSQANAARPTRLLIVGADQFARDAAIRLQRLSFAPCLVVGYVRLPGQEAAIQDRRVYDLEQFSSSLPKDGIDEAVMAVHPAQFSQIPRILKALEKLCVPVRAIVDLGEGIVVRERLFQLGRLQMLDLTTTPAESLDYALLKRVFDVCFSAMVLFLMSPVIALIALVIRQTSPGPVFFQQDRVGLNGLTFRMYKFRTMHVAAVSESDIRWTTKGDSRTTGFGAFLRKTSLDELPQFINVLKGEMSVVGPRPERPHFVEQFLQQVARYNRRHSLKVGITGWAQVNGWRGDTSIEKRVEFDLYYLQNWSLAFDLRIIGMTILSGLINRNAY